MVTTDGRIGSVWVAHMLGQRHGPLVKLRVQGVDVPLDGMLGDEVEIEGQLPPEQARRIAGHLLAAAARAEYEADLVETMKAEGWKPQMISAVLMMVRAGEVAREEQSERIGEQD